MNLLLQATNQNLSEKIYPGRFSVNSTNLPFLLRKLSSIAAQPAPQGQYSGGRDSAVL